jgi:hypothetical protein
MRHLGFKDGSEFEPADRARSLGVAGSSAPNGLPARLSSRLGRLYAKYAHRFSEAVLLTNRFSSKKSYFGF